MYRVMMHQWSSTVKTFHFYFALFWVGAMQIISVNPLKEFAKEMAKPLCIMESFIYLSCDTYISVAMFLGIIFLISDIPFDDGDEAYILMRIGRAKWIFGKIAYLFSACILYYFMALVIGMLYISPNAYIGNIWSEVIYILVKQPYLDGTSLYFPYAHILLMSPLRAVFSGLILNILHAFSMSVFLLLFNLLFQRTIGYLLTMIIFVSGYVLTILFLSLNYAKLTLFGNSLLMYHSVDNQHKNTFFLFRYLFLFFGDLLLWLYILYVTQFMKWIVESLQ